MVDFDQAMLMDIQRIPVKTLRKVIPRLRVLCYKVDEATLGKKKCKCGCKCNYRNLSC